MSLVRGGAGRGLAGWKGEGAGLGGSGLGGKGERAGLGGKREGAGLGWKGEGAGRGRAGPGGAGLGWKGDGDWDGGGIQDGCPRLPAARGRCRGSKRRRCGRSGELTFGEHTPQRQCATGPASAPEDARSNIAATATNYSSVRLVWARPQQHGYLLDTCWRPSLLRCTCAMYHMLDCFYFLAGSGHRI